MSTAATGSNTWTNSDGLRVMFPPDSTKSNRAASTNQAGDLKTLTVDLDYADMPVYTASDTILGRVPVACVPAGALLRTATLIPTTAFTGAGATLDIGMCKQDGTVIDGDGIDAAIALTAIDAIGETVVCDGALINTVLVYDSYVTVNVDVATLTAGRAKLILAYLIPDGGT